MKHNIKELIKSKVHFLYYRAQHLYYKTESGFIFTVPIEDCGGATFLAEDKAITFMRYIRKELEFLQT